MQIDFWWFIFISDTRSLWLTNVLFWRSLYDYWVHFYRCSCFCQIFISYFYPVAILSFWDAMKTKFTPCKKVRWHRIAAANFKSLRFVHSTHAISFQLATCHFIFFCLFFKVIIIFKVVWARFQIIQGIRHNHPTYRWDFSFSVSKPAGEKKLC